MARKHKCPDDDGSSRWLGTYGDAVTLLMAFFVMLYSMSEVDSQKFKSFVQGLTVFGNESSAASLLPGGSGLNDGDAVVDTSGLPIEDPAMPAPPAPAAPDQPIDQPSTGPLIVSDAADGGGGGDEGGTDPGGGPASDSDDERVGRRRLGRIKQKVMDALEDAGVPSVASYRFDQRGLVISITADDVLFSTGSTTISSRGRDVVRAVAKALRPFDNEVFVEGHTDDVPLRRGGYTNWNLSTDRAVAVVTMLYRDFGIQQSRLAASGYGEFRPVATNETAAGRAQNRRVDILIVAEGNDDG